MIILKKMPIVLTKDYAGAERIACQKDLKGGEVILLPDDAILVSLEDKEGEKN